MTSPETINNNDGALLKVDQNVVESETKSIIHNTGKYEHNRQIQKGGKKKIHDFDKMAFR